MLTKLLKPEDLKKISDDAEGILIREHENRRRQEEADHDKLREAFMAEDIPPDVMNHINTSVRNAAEHCRNDIQVFTFPAEFCNDRGRRINNQEPDWPDSLEGLARRAYQFYKKELQPLGYKLRVEILDYPGGVPGKVAFYLIW